MNAPDLRGAARAPLDDLPLSKAVLPSGVELHYAISGTGPRLIFIHGAMGDWRSWEPQWDAFVAAGYQCLTYSRRYSFPNRNDMPSPDHGALQEAQDLAGLLDAIGWDNAILVGSSYGGFTALALAVARPERVMAVVAVEPPMMKYAEFSEAGRQARDAFRRETIEPANAAFRAGQDEEAGRIMTGGINGAVSAATTPQAMQRRLQNLRAMRMLALSSDEFPLLSPAQVAALTMPVMLLSGQRTAPVHREIFNNLVQAMPAARVLRVPDAGHGVTREQPAVFNAQVLAFLAEHTLVPAV